MRKFVFGGLLLCALALLAGTGPATAVAQKKDTKGGTIEVGKGKDGKYRFTVRNAKGKLLAMSGPTGYATEKDVQKVIEELKDVLRTAKVTKKASKGQK